MRRTQTRRRAGALGARRRFIAGSEEGDKKRLDSAGSQSKRAATAVAATGPRRREARLARRGGGSCYKEPRSRSNPSSAPWLSAQEARAANLEGCCRGGRLQGGQGYGAQE